MFGCDIWGDGETDGVVERSFQWPHPDLDPVPDLFANHKVGTRGLRPQREKRGILMTKLTAQARRSGGSLHAEVPAPKKQQRWHLLPGAWRARWLSGILKRLTVDAANLCMHTRGIVAQKNRDRLIPASPFDVLAPFPSLGMRPKAHTNDRRQQFSGSSISEHALKF